MADEPDQYAGRNDFLPRLTPNFYRGDAVVLWTLPVKDRGQGWLEEKFHAGFRELLLHTLARQGLACPVYVLMPDHLHMVWMGLREESDQKIGMAFFRTYLEPMIAPLKFQHQAHDQVLREDERKRAAFANVCDYILMNPVRARLVQQASEWPFLGAMVSGYPKLNPMDQDFWPAFWKIYVKLKKRNQPSYQPT